MRFLTGVGGAFAALLLCTAAIPVGAEAADIALTFDDLPALTILKDQPYVTYLNRMILRGLRRHHLPATGFVNEGKLDDLDRAKQIEVLRLWLDAGMDLGNHTLSHESPNALGAKGYIEDVLRGEPVTRRLLAERHRQLRWFRHPYLETGAPQAVKLEIDRWLAEHHYRIAPVTIDADDWEFAEPYDDAIARRDEPRRQRIKAQYLDYTRSMMVWHRKASQALFGRDVAYVMLLHATRLNADSIEDIAAMLKAQHLRGVTLDEAMRDKAYQTPDPYVGRDGVDWMERWSLELHKELPWDSYKEAPADIQAEYDRVDSDR